MEAHAYRGPKSRHPMHATGVKYLSGLHFVPLFDIIRDMCPDMMHVVQRLLPGRLMPLLKGFARPARFKDLKPKTGETKAEIKTRESHNRTGKKDRDAVVRDVMLCEMSKVDLRTLDQRSLMLGGQKTWVRNNLLISQRTGSINAHDWLKLLGPGLHYIFKDIGNRKVIGAFLGFMDVLLKLVQANADMPWKRERWITSRPDSRGS